MVKKYELTDEIKIINTAAREVTLHRIRATRNFSDIYTGDLGGWVEKEENLSHEGNCWVYDEAQIYDKSRIFDDATIADNIIVCSEAQIYNQAHVYCNVQIYGQVKVYGNADISDDAIILDEARVYDDTIIYGSVHIEGAAKIFGRACIHGQAEVSGKAQVHGSVCVEDNAKVTDSADIFDHATVCGSAIVQGKAVICGTALISGDIHICGNARISRDNHYMIVGPIGSNRLYATLFRTKYNNISIVYDDYYKDVNDFINKNGLESLGPLNSIEVNIFISMAELLKNQITQQPTQNMDTQTMTEQIQLTDMQQIKSLSF